MEFSKKLVLVILGILGVAMVASYVLPMFSQYMAEVCVEIFQTVATQMGSVQIAYFGKAGFENYDKNKKLLGFSNVNNLTNLHDANETDNGEGGSG